MGDLELGTYILEASASDAPPLKNANVYRRMVHASMTTSVEKALPELRRMLGEEGLAALVDRFLAAGGPKTSLYRDIPGDFVEWIGTTDHPLADLAHFEWLDMTARRHLAEVDDLPPAREDFVIPNPTMQVGVYARPVHLMGEDERDPEPFVDPMAILVWRRPRTDQSAHLVVGLLIAKALAIAIASEAPLRIGELASRVAAEAPGLAEDDVQAALEHVVAELVEEDGIVGG